MTIARRGTETHTGTTTVAVRATDQITAQGAAAHLSAYSELTVLAPHEHQQCHVLLVLANKVTDAAIDLIRDTALAHTGGGPALVLVADEIDDKHLLRAVEYGLVSFLLRGQTDFDHVAEAIRAAQAGYIQLPAAVLHSLLNRLDGGRTHLPRGHGLPNRLTVRETDVLRLLSEGLDTAEVATNLNYSERTVKSVIHQALTRLKLRNRVHAVAYALRTGAID